MRQLLISVFIIFSALGLQAQGDSTQVQQPVMQDDATTTDLKNVSEEVQTEYQEGNYKKVIELIEAEIKTEREQGRISADLYYNLGNAYFRTNDFANAILNYERAQLYNPGDRDTKHNLEYAQTKVEDKILTADNFFLKIWFDGVQNLLTSNTWASMSIGCFILFIGCLFLFFFSPRLSLKKTGFYLGIVLLVFLLFTNIFAFNQKSKIENRNTAIVMVGSAAVVSSPNTTSKELFVLHSGTKVEITKTDGSWCEIEMANGSVGWVQSSMIEII